MLTLLPETSSMSSGTKRCRQSPSPTLAETWPRRRFPSARLLLRSASPLRRTKLPTLSSPSPSDFRTVPQSNSLLPGRRRSPAATSVGSSSASPYLCVGNGRHATHGSQRNQPPLACLRARTTSTEELKPDL